MNKTLSTLCIVLPVWLWVPGAIVAAATTYTDVAPIMQQHCIICHSGPNAVRGVRLDTLDGILKGSDRGLVIDVGNPKASELIRRVKGESVPRMPMTGPPFLTDAEVAILEEWIAAGTPQGEVAEQADDMPATMAVPASASVTFDRIAPILATRCAKCHTDNGIMGPPPEGYRLTSYASVIASTDRVRVVPGNPSASELLRRIGGQSQPRMPLDGPPWLSTEEYELIEAWIAAGAQNSAGNEAPVPVGARVRLEGTLRTGWHLDDLQLDVTSRTRIDKDPQPGDRVRVRASVREDASLAIERVRRR